LFNRSLLSVIPAVSAFLFAAELPAQQPHGGRLETIHQFTLGIDEGIDVPYFRRFGDVDGDSIPEFLMIRPSDSSGGTPEGGSVELLSGATLEDVNGDGVPDLAIGSPEYSSAGMNENGAVFVYSGAAPYGLIGEWVGLSDWSGFGTAVADAGDHDGDGTSDLLIGAPWEDSAGGEFDVGATYVFASGLPQNVGLYNWLQGSFPDSVTAKGFCRPVTSTATVAMIG